MRPSSTNDPDTTEIKPARLRFLGATLAVSDAQAPDSQTPLGARVRKRGLCSRTASQARAQSLRRDTRSLARARPRKRGLCIGNKLQGGEPGGGFAVAGRAPVATRRERSTRTDFRRIGDATALELAEFEKAIKKKLQMLFDLGE